MVPTDQNDTQFFVLDPASRSWLRTGCARPARAWIKSPNMVSCSALVIFLLNWPISNNLPWWCAPDTGMPTLRKVAAFPKWVSAMNKVFSLGQKTARSGKRSRDSPCHSMDTEPFTVMISSPVPSPFFAPVHSTILSLPATVGILPTAEIQKGSVELVRCGRTFAR